MWVLYHTDIEGSEEEHKSLTDWVSTNFKLAFSSSGWAKADTDNDKQKVYT